MSWGKFKALILLISIVSSSFFVLHYVPAVHAQTGGAEQQGQAEIYFLDLPDVGNYNSWVNNQSAVISGAIEALSISGQGEPPVNEPMVHIEEGKIAPFWTVQYAIVSDWTTYEDLILNSVGKIILNTDGQILPVPADYSASQWIDMIADAMSYRQLTWANMAGWPFYYAWQQGANETELLGPSGFQELMKHIGLPGVRCDTPQGGSQQYVTLSGPAGHILFPPKGYGWSDLSMADQVSLTCPLEESDFQNAVMFPLYYTASSPYYEGAVIVFAPPGQRLDPSSAKGCGFFVDLGTNQTYTVNSIKTNADEWRGYVVMAAAAWAVSCYCTPKTETQTFYGLHNSGPTVQEIHVNPMVLGYWYDGPTPSGSPNEYNLSNGYTVQIAFGVYALAQVVTDSGDEGISGPQGCISFQADNANRSGVLLQADLQDSRMGNKTGLSLTNAGYNSNFGLSISTATFLIGLVDPTHITDVLDGIMLFSDWLNTVTGEGSPSLEQGVSSPATSVSYDFNPIVVGNSTLDSNSIIYEETESLLVLNVYIPATIANAFDWQVIPINYQIGVSTALGTTYVCGLVPITAWFQQSPNNYQSIFFENWQGDYSDWIRYDNNSAAADDYWGTTRDYNGYAYIEPDSMWCAGVGNNTLSGSNQSNWNTTYYNGEYYIQARTYSPGMDAFLMYIPANVPGGDLSNASFFCSDIILYFQAEYDMNPGDYLQVLNGSQVVQTISGNENYYSEQTFYINLNHIDPNGGFGFLFHSAPNSTCFNFGVSINYVGLYGVICQNDTGISSYAPHSQSLATEMPVLTCYQTYDGYLAGGANDPEDWYALNISQANPDYQSGTSIYIEMDPQSNVNFALILYDPNGTQVAYSDAGIGLSAIINYMPSPDQQGLWELGVIEIGGYGHYQIFWTFDDFFCSPLSMDDQVGITGYKVVFEDTMNNSLSSPATIDYYWSFSVPYIWSLTPGAGWHWGDENISSSTVSVTQYVIPANTTADLDGTYVLPSSGNNRVGWGDWITVSFTFHWTYNSTSYSTDCCTTKLNVHPGDITGAAVTLPYLGATGYVTGLDLHLLAINWLQSVPSGTNPTSALARADIDGAGSVTGKDLHILALDWLQSWTNTPPS
ncbi:MAG TPA: hypothetical protein VK487_08330 [Candidatus Bathyarchaeia archaeon]|nr:hypothetical protein [Candidatus Bathyarchaeia archaeon]